MDEHNVINAKIRKKEQKNDACAPLIQKNQFLSIICRQESRN